MNRDPMMYDQSKYASMRYAQVKRPMAAPCPAEAVDNCGCDDDDGYAVNFAAWELRLYLDTHPWDSDALAAYNKLCAENGTKCTYSCHTKTAHGMPLREKDDCGCEHGHGRERVWHWIDDPWPWEPSANLKGGRC